MKRFLTVQEQRRRDKWIFLSAVVVVVLATYLYLGRTVVEWRPANMVDVTWMDGLNQVYYHRDDRFERISVSPLFFGERTTADVKPPLSGEIPQGFEQRFEHARKAVNESW